MEEENIQYSTKETSRIEAFSDGVFAIAITLLVLEVIQLIKPEEGVPLATVLFHHWQSFLAFTIGFITILVCWINHHTAVEYIRKVDINLMWINGFLLFLVTLIPFSTALLAEYLDKEAGTALSIFGFHFFLISVAADLICSYSYSHHLISPRHREFYASYKLIYRFAIFYTIIALVLCYVSIFIPIILYVILFTVFAAPKVFARRIDRMRRGVQ